MASLTDEIAPKDPPKSASVKHQCKIVAQRANSSSLLLDNKDSWASLDRSLIISISFTKAATIDILPKVVKGILNMPVLTMGEWGDGTKPVSLSTLIEKKCGKDFGLMIIPAAALNCKLKGKYIQYRDQCEKVKSKELYEQFKECLKESLVNIAKKCDGKIVNKTNPQQHQGTRPDIPPTLMFQKPPFENMYKNFDEKGMPTHAASGEELTKSAKKKLVKLYNRQMKRHEKFLKNPDAFKDEMILAKQIMETNIAGKDPINNTKLQIPEETLPIKLVCGTFGNRQGLRLDAECGPFSHVVEF